MILMRPRAVMSAGGETSGTFTHWRIRRLASVNSGNVGLAELSFGTPATGGTVLFSSQTESVSYYASNAFDGSASTRWMSASGDVVDAFIGYAWPDVIDVQSVTITASNKSTSLDMTPTAFAVESSADGGTTWDTHWTEQDITWTVGQTQTFTRP